MKTLVIALALLAAGCTSTHWSKPGGTLEAFNRDSYACANEARQAWFEFRRGPLAFGPSGDEKGINKNMYRLCLQARGYERSDSGTWVGVRD